MLTQHMPIGAPTPPPTEAASRAAAALEHQAQVDKRRYPRRPVLWAGGLELDGVIYPGQVLNVSAGGAMLRLAQSLPEGAPVVAHLRDDVRLAGFIRWARDGRHGITFVDTAARVRRTFGGQAKALGLYRGKRRSS